VGVPPLKYKCRSTVTPSPNMGIELFDTHYMGVGLYFNVIYVLYHQCITCHMWVGVSAPCLVDFYMSIISVSCSVDCGCISAPGVQYTHYGDRPCTSLCKCNSIIVHSDA
jgi:hypothetical protein